MKAHINFSRFKPNPTPLNLILLSALLVAIFFLIQGDVGLDIADEGFLWYGTIRTALGEVPIRDFQSYDPGRYYWGALWFKLLGSTGIMSLRVSQAIFQFCGLSIFLVLLRRVVRNWLALIVAGGLLLLWMFPPWKIYEPVVTILAVYVAVLLIERPSTKRHLVAGIFVGLAAFMGRNHGAYCFAAFLLLTIFIWWRIDRGNLALRIGALGLGMVIGYSPMLLMLAIVPGFFRSFVNAITTNLRQGTNLPLPVPWPWVPNYSRLSLSESIHAFSVGVSYLTLPLFYLTVGACLLLRNKFRDNALLIASTFVGTMYLHYAFDRAHLYYVAWTVPPLLMGLFALPQSIRGANRKIATVAVWSFLLVLSLTSAGMAPYAYPLYKAKAFVRAKTARPYREDLSLAMRRHYGLVRADIAGDHLWVSEGLLGVLDAVKAVNEKFIPANERVLIAPYWTTLYPILGKECPTWESYFLFKQPKDIQEGMISELERKNVSWAIVCHNIHLDARNDLDFENTHNDVWKYLSANFEKVETDRLPRDCDLLHRPVGASPQK